jgi:plastocyanin
MSATSTRTRAKARLAIGAIAALFLATIGVSLAAPAAQAQEAESVMIMDYAFTPADLTIPVGTTVVWTNMDAAAHDVVSTDGGPLDSPNLATGDTFEFTFDTPGTYEYFCSLHPDMTGTITVTGDGTEPPPTTEPPTDPDCPEGGLVAAVVDPFWAHFQSAHLETGPLDQVADITDVNQYVLTHTVLVEQMVSPVYSTVSSALNGLTPFWVHFQSAHLETGPMDQVTDILNTDQYVLTHTVLVEDMLEPTMGPVTGSC